MHRINGINFSLEQVNKLTKVEFVKIFKAKAEKKGDDASDWYDQLSTVIKAEKAKAKEAEKTETSSDESASEGGE